MPEVINNRAGTAIKTLDENGRVGGYLVVWGSPAQKDLQGEYFTPETELGLDWYPQRPALYHHGLDDMMKSSVIGRINSLRADTTGVWAEAQLEMHNAYVQAVLELVKKGALGWSSGSLPHLVEVSPDGQIKRWPIVEGSLTPTPAEPRRTDIHTIKSAYTQLGLDTDKLNFPALTEEAKEPPAEEQPRESATDEQSTTRIKAMNIQAILRAVLGALMQARTDIQLTPEEQAGILAAAEQALSGTDPAAMSAPETAIAAVTPIVGKAFMALVQKRQQESEAFKAALKTSTEAFIKGVPPQKLPSFTGGQAAMNGGGGQRGFANDIQMRTKYHAMSAEDMSFYAGFRNAIRQRLGLTPVGFEREFFVELADKASKSLDAGKIKLGDEKETQAAIKSINAIKANELDYSTQAGFGDEWVPNMWSSQVWEKTRLDNVIAPLLRNIEMPSNPFELPVQSSDPTVYFVSETKDEASLTLASSANPIPDSKVATGKVTLTAQKLALRTMLAVEVDEDSIIPFVGMVREQALRAIEDAIDNVLLNGDTATGASTNINLIDGTPGGTEKYLAFNGLRKLALVTNTANSVDGGGVAPTLAQLRQTRFTLDRAYSAKPDNLAWLAPSESYAKLLGLTEFITMDKAGNLATALTGEIGKMDGASVLVSNEYPLANAAGKVPNAGGTLGSLLCLYKPGWYMGYRRRINANMEFLSYYDAYVLTATVRLALVARDNEVAAILYNSGV